MVNNGFLVVYPIGGFHSHGGTPIARWFRWENPVYQWMMIFWGAPISGNLHIFEHLI